MILTKAVKSTALATLKDKWLWGCFVSLIPFFAMAAAYLIGTVMSFVIGDFAILVGLVLNVLLTSVVFLGALRVFWFCANGVDEPIGSVFYYFSNKAIYKRALSFVLRIVVPLLLNSFVLFLPAAVLFLIADGKIFELFGMTVPVFSIGLKNLGYFLAIVGLIILLFRMLNFFVGAFLFVSNDEIPANECIAVAVRISKCCKSIYTGHIFGYLGWILISLFALPLIFTAPYLLMSYVVDCRFCVAYYNRIGENRSSAPIYSC